MSFEEWDIWSSGHAKKVFYKKYVGDLVLQVSSGHTMKNKVPTISNEKWPQKWNWHYSCNWYRWRVQKSKQEHHVSLTTQLFNKIVLTFVTYRYQRPLSPFRSQSITISVKETRYRSRFAMCRSLRRGVNDWLLTFKIHISRIS